MLGSVEWTLFFVHYLPRLDAVIARQRQARLFIGFHYPEASSVLCPLSRFYDTLVVIFSYTSR